MTSAIPARGPAPGGESSAPITAALGPTNTGKTHLAVERMLAHSSGMIGLPLRLLAREIYDRVVKIKGEAAAALITGEEKIIPSSARYFICTAEAMPVSKPVAFMAIDEVQLAADPERGHVFTDRMLHARGTQETMILGSATMTGQILDLVPDAEIVTRERFSQLTYAGPSKLTRLPRRSAIVAFSAESVYAIAELLRRRRGGAAVVMGGLSPRTRNAQVELYQSGEVDFLVATDAIGMGLNMDIDHVAFAEARKFDGQKTRRLRPSELSQIAGRAGRFRSDGTFGETGDCRPFDPDVVEAIESHRFNPVERLSWRNPDLDDSSLDALRYTLNKPTPHPALERVRESSDERALDVLAGDHEVRDRVTNPAMVERLWDCCRLPDFRKATIDAHARLVKSIFMHLSTGNGRLPNSWMAGQLEKLDKTAGDVDALAARLAHVRTWAYAAHRSDWTQDPEHWRGETRRVEDNLSDALHERLMQRFVDRRTSALMKGLRDEKDLLAGVSAEGDVTVEGHYVGRLDGLVFKPDAEGKEAAAKALRSAALKALQPELNRRLSALANASVETLSIDRAGQVFWQDEVIGTLSKGHSLLQPGVRLTGGELGSADMLTAARHSVQSRVEEIFRTQLAPLFGLKTGANDPEIAGAARGVLFRLYEAGGALPRHEIAEEIKALEQPERRALRQLGVRIGEHMIYLPALVKPAPAQHYALLRALEQDDLDTSWMPGAGLTSVANDKTRRRADYAAIGYQTCGPRAVRFDMLERLADEIRDGRKKSGKSGFELTAEMTALLGSSVEDLRGVLSALGYRRVKKGADPEKLEGEVWAPRRTARADDKAEPAGTRSPKREGKPRGKDTQRGRPQASSRGKPAPQPSEPDADNPFAVLAALKLDNAEPKKSPKKSKRRRSRKPKTDAAAAQTQPEPANDEKKEPQS
ncbi:MAG: ATP-dependent DNA helicase [Alphaproteobacteria bacterium]|nr:ATP-dependent DNA helicase [Alphaproteobacteria bacterium]